MPSPFPRVNEILAEGPLRKNKFYEVAAANPGLVKKVDGVSIVDRAKYYEILSAAPAATLPDPNNPNAVAARLRQQQEGARKKKRAARRS
jgi:hypothetical protein